MHDFLPPFSQQNISQQISASNSSKKQQTQHHLLESTSPSLTLPSFLKNCTDPRHPTPRSHWFHLPFPPHHQPSSHFLCTTRPNPRPHLEKKNPNHQLFFSPHKNKKSKKKRRATPPHPPQCPPNRTTLGRRPPRTTEVPHPHPHPPTRPTLSNPTLSSTPWTHPHG